MKRDGDLRAGSGDCGWPSGRILSKAKAWKDERPPTMHCRASPDLWRNGGVSHNPGGWRQCLPADTCGPRDPWLRRPIRARHDGLGRRNRGSGKRRHLSRHCQPRTRWFQVGLPGPCACVALLRWRGDPDIRHGDVCVFHSQHGTAFRHRRGGARSMAHLIQQASQPRKASLKGGTGRSIRL